MEQHILHTKPNTAMLRSMDCSGSGTVSELEWLEYMVLSMHRLSEQELVDIKTQFQKVAGSRMRMVELARQRHSQHHPSGSTTPS